MSIENDASLILTCLYPHGTNEYFDGNEVAKETSLSPAQINDAIEILESNGYVQLRKWMRTTPYRFGNVSITSHGRYAVEKAKKEPEQVPETTPAIRRNLEPVGSPYGFLDEDWEYITEERDSSEKLKVVFGYQFKSEFYDSSKLADNIKAALQQAVSEYNSDPKSINIDLDFVQLGAGYGEHVFTEIAKDIISADIAIFDTSDLNPNVMLEMGVALTWGVRVLPIRNNNCPPPPSDISGQTWAAYEPETDGSNFEDRTFKKKLMGMVKRAAQKKVK